MKSIGKAIRKVREARSLSLDGLSILAKVNRQNIHRYERGLNQPNMTTFFKLCRALEIDPWRLMRIACREAL